MRYMIRLGLLIAATAILMLVGCKPGIVLNDEYVDRSGDVELATFGDGLTLTAEHFFDRINESTMLMPGGTLEVDRARFLLDSILLDTLAGLEAREIRLDRHYKYFITYRHQYYDYLTYMYWQKTLYEKAQVDSLEVLQFFHDNSHLFEVEEQIDLYHILASPYSFTVGPESTYYKSVSRDELWNVAESYIKNIHRLLGWGAPFENVAFNYSHDASSREQGGHMGWTPRGTYIDPFDSIAFSLEEGEYSEPYQDKDGWHIIWAAHYQPAGPMPIDSPQVYESARQTVLTAQSNDGMRMRFDSLHGEINIAHNEAIMEENLHLLDDTVWAFILNGRDTVDVNILRRLEEKFRIKYDVDNTTPEQKLEMMREASDRYIQVQAARAAGIDTLPVVVERERHLRHGKQKAIVLQRAVDLIWEPDDSVVRAYYDAHIDDYVYPRPMKVEVITVGDSAFAEFLRGQAESGLDMGEIVREHSGAGRLRARLTLPGYVGSTDLEPALYAAARLVYPGSVSEVVITKPGEYQFAKVLDRKESRVYDHAKGEIRMNMIRDHRQRVWERYRAELYAKYEVKFMTRLSKIVLGNYHTRRKSN
ncbi:MAG: peptidylprolyl isomerase [Candidatus Zixiibacteriota bacterium]|nr:MAG: peptidylprolyl isomerase [candidate division Zixibacteria bacterium]